MKKHLILFFCFFILKNQEIFSQFNLGKKNNPPANNAQNPAKKDSNITSPPNLKNADTIKSVKSVGKNKNEAQDTSLMVLKPATSEEIQSDTNNELLDNNTPKSLRKNDAFTTTESDNSDVNNENKPLEYNSLRAEDALLNVTVWEEIDAREKLNQSFLYQGKDDYGDQRFFAILVRAVTREGVTAFSSEAGDDRFTKPMSMQEIITLIRGNVIKQLVQNVNNPNVYDTLNILNSAVSINPDSVYTFRLKVNYIFDRATSTLYKRIIGIAPVAKIKLNNVSSQKTLFWIYYPDLRPYLAKNYVYNPHNLASVMSWDDLFENRYFSSYFVKTTLSNYNNLYLSSIIKDPIQRLLESDRLKEQIYNKESDMWVY